MPAPDPASAPLTVCFAPSENFHLILTDDDDAYVKNDLTCAKNIRNKLVELVQSSSYPSAEDLQKVSSNEMMITPDVIASIRNRTTEEQAVSISKIAEDVAV